MKKIYTILLAVLLLGGASTAFALPYYRTEQSILPFLNSTYYLGTSSPSTQAWKAIYADQICLTADICRSVLTGGGGGSGGGTWSTTTSSVLNRFINYPNNTTDIPCIGGTATTTCKTYFDPTTNLNQFNGVVSIGNSVAPQLTGYGTGYYQLHYSTSTNDIAGADLYNINTGTQAAIGIFLQDNKSNLGGIGLLQHYYGGLIYSGGNWDGPSQGLGALPASSLGLFTVDGKLVLGSATSTGEIDMYTGGNSFGGGVPDALINNLGQFSVASTTPWGQLSASSTSIYPTLAVEQKSTGPAAVITGGNVGISNIVPSTLLTVGAGTNAGASLPGVALGINGGASYSVSAGTHTAFLGVNGSNQPTLGTFTNDSLVLVTNNNQKGILTTGGNLGIGTSTPGTTLSVSGDSVLAGRVTSPQFAATSTTASSTFQGITANLINVTSTTASSTFANGVNLTGGCFAINGSCISGSGAGGSGTVTSVTLATPNSSLSLGGTNPVTTSGTINADINVNHANFYTALQNFTFATTSTFGATSTVYLTGVGSAGGLGIDANGKVYSGATSTLSTISGVLPVGSGGTGNTTFTGANLLYGNGTGSIGSIATTTVTCAGTVACTTFTTLGGTPITLTGSGGGGGAGTYPFTPSTNFAAATNATTGVVWFQNGLQASTTSFFDRASTTVSTIFGDEYVGRTLSVATSTPFGTFSVNPVAGVSANRFVVGSSSATSFIIDNGGNVGVGTTTPNATFAVTGNTNRGTLPKNVLLVQGTDDGNSYGQSIELRSGNGGGVNIFSGSASSAVGDAGGVNIQGGGSAAAAATAGAINITAGSNTGQFAGSFAAGVTINPGVGNDGVFGHGTNTYKNVSIANVGGNANVGTTTSTYKFTVSSTTAPQIALSSGAGFAEWTERGVNGNFYLSTSTISNGNATSSLAALTIFQNGGFGIATNTPGTILSIGNNTGINFDISTSTFNTTGGININSGCFSVRSTCITGGTGATVDTGGFNFAYPFPNNATSTQLTFSAGLIATNASTTNFIATTTLGVATSTPGTPLSVTGAGTFTGQVEALNFYATSTTATSTFLGQISGNRVTAATARFTGLVSCDTIDSDLYGNLVCGTDATGAGGSVTGNGITGMMTAWSSGSNIVGTSTIIGERFVATSTTAASSTIPNLALTNLQVTGNAEIGVPRYPWLSGMLLSVDSTGLTEATGTPTAGFFNATSTTASSTFQGTEVNLLHVRSTIASSTFENGINLTKGCFAINSVCITGGAASSASTTLLSTDSNTFFGATTTFNLGLQANGYTNFAGTTTLITNTLHTVENKVATGTTMNIDWGKGNFQTVNISTSAITLNFTNPTYGDGLSLLVCNQSSGTAGTITWPNNVSWPGGIAPGQTTTANQCDLWSWRYSVGTSTATVGSAKYFLTGLTSGYQ